MAISIVSRATCGVIQAISAHSTGGRMDYIATRKGIGQSISLRLRHVCFFLTGREVSEISASRMESPFNVSLDDRKCTFCQA